MLGYEAFEISNKERKERINVLCLRDFLSKMGVIILDPSTRQMI